MDLDSYQTALEEVLTWLLSAEDALQAQGDISSDVEVVKEQFHTHEVCIYNHLLLVIYLLGSCKKIKKMYIKQIYVFVYFKFLFVEFKGSTECKMLKCSFVLQDLRRVWEKKKFEKSGLEYGGIEDISLKFALPFQ